MKLLLAIAIFFALFTAKPVFSETNLQSSSVDLQYLIKELLIEEELRGIIQSGEDTFYKVYIFDNAGNTKYASLKYWRGLLLFPDLSNKSILVNLRSNQNNFDNWWYLNRDESFSKYIEDPQNDIIGLVTISEDHNLLLSYDLDGDRILDVIYKNSDDGKEVLIVNESNGSDFLDSSIELNDPLCNGEFRPNSNLGNTIDIRGILDICGSSGDGADEESGLGGLGISPGNTGSGFDLLDTLCKGISNGSSSIGSGITSDDGYTQKYIDTFRGVINNGFDGEPDSLPVNVGRVGIWWFAPGVFEASKAGLVIAMAIDVFGLEEEVESLKKVVNELLPDTDTDSTQEASDNQDDTEEEDDNNSAENTDETENNNEGTVITGNDEETQPGCISGDPNCETGNDALKDLCDRLNSDNDFLDSIEDAEDQAAADNNCDDPVVNPNPAEASEE